MARRRKPTLRLPEATTLVVDSREPKTIDSKLTQVGFTVSRQALPTGDYLWVTSTGLTVCVERKTGSDLLGSMGSRQANGKPRLQNQMDRLRAFDIPILLIEGFLETHNTGFASVKAGQPSGWLWDSIDNALLSLQRGGILVVRCGSGRVPERLVSLRNYFDKKTHRYLSSATEPDTLEETTQEETNV